MKLSRQHFEFIAKEIAPLCDVYQLDALTEAVRIASKNPRFDSDKFKRRAKESWDRAYMNSERFVCDDEIPY